MDSADNSSEDDERDSVSNQIFEYYKKFSQSRELPKYFSGTSISYMPEIVPKEDVPAITVEEPPLNASPIDQQEQKTCSSPASSVTSNRKLEWDNGADIGYNNCLVTDRKSLLKSSSLPNLGENDSRQNGDKGNQIIMLTTHSTTSETDFGNNKDQEQSLSSTPKSKQDYTVVASSSSSNSDMPEPEDNVIPSSKTTSLEAQSVQASSSSSNSSKFTTALAYLKSRIGTPDAESTPKSANAESTPKSANAESTPKSANAESTPKSAYTETPLSSKPSKDKIVLTATKPILITCLDIARKSGSDKKIQTTVSEQLAKSIQTGDSLEKNVPKTIIAANPSSEVVNNQSIIVVNHDSQSSTSKTQTDSEIMGSPCDSFEFVQGSGYREMVGGAELRRSKASSNLVQGSSSSSATNDLPVLSQLISQNQSHNLVGDINKSIELLQKLLKSKKYDEATKKRYVKKIIKKIVNSKYVDDSTNNNSNSSNSDRPPSSENLESESKIQQNLQANVPWYPAQNFSVKTFSEEFLPLEEQNEEAGYLPSGTTSSKDKSSSSDRIHPKKKSVFTYSLPKIGDVASTSGATKNTKRSSSGSRKDTIEAKPNIATSSSSVQEELIQDIDHHQQQVSSSSYNSWKEDKTQSERLFEARLAQGDHNHLIQFAKKERQHQIAWIDDEITHLSKLKCLLEKRHSSGKQRALTNFKKTTTTTVYTVSQNFGKNTNEEQQQEEEASSSSTGASKKSKSSHSKKGRNYVIQTELDGGSSASTSQIDFNFKSPNTGAIKKYRVRHKLEQNSDADTGQRGVKSDSGKFVGDIEVISDASTTNIKVKTRKLSLDEDKREVKFQPKEPVLTGGDRRCVWTYPRSRQEASRDPRCCPCSKTMNVACRNQRTVVRSRERYAFEVPLDKKRAVLSDKVCEILDKYAERLNRKMAAAAAPAIENDGAAAALGQAEDETVIDKVVPFKAPQLTDGKPCRCGMADSGQRQGQRPLICLCDDKPTEKTADNDDVSNKQTRDANKKSSVRIEHEFELLSSRNRATKCKCAHGGQTGRKKMSEENAQIDECYCTNRSAQAECIPKLTCHDQNDDQSEAKKCRCRDRNRQTDDGITEARNIFAQKLVHNVAECYCRDRSNQTECVPKWICHDNGDSTNGVQPNAPKSSSQEPNQQVDGPGSKNIAGQKLLLRNADCYCTDRSSQTECIPKLICHDRDGQPDAANFNFKEQNQKVDDQNAKGIAGKTLSQPAECYCSDQSTQAECVTKLICYDQTQQKQPQKHHQQRQQSSDNENAQPKKCQCKNQIQQTDVSPMGAISSQTRPVNVSVEKLQTDQCFCTDKSSQADCVRKLVCHDRGVQDIGRGSGVNANAQTCKCPTGDHAAQTQRVSTDDHKLQTNQISKSDVISQTSYQGDNKITQTSKLPTTSYSSSQELEGVRDDGDRRRDRDRDRTRDTTVSSLTSSSSDSYSSDDEETGSCRQSCSCCKRRNAEVLYNLRRQLDDRSYPLCKPCYRQNRRGMCTVDMYDNPSHTCGCYTAVQTKTLDEIKQTIRDLEDIERYCTCANSGSGGGSRRGGDCCTYCKCKLRKTSKSKNGIAYVLTLENETPGKSHRHHRKKKKKKRSLEEIRIKIPMAGAHKKRKNKENRKRRDKERLDRHGITTSSITSETRVGHARTLQEPSMNIRDCLSPEAPLQKEYLNQNRPDFVEMADERRNRVIETRIEREEAKQQRDKLILKEPNHLEKNGGKRSKRLFSAKEMIEMTKKKYQKLPEVQQKLLDNKEKHLKEANRLFVDTFNRKLKENVLKGKRSLPLNVNVVSL